MTSVFAWFSGRREYFFYLSIIVSATILSFLKSVYFAKELTSEDFGVYSLVLTSYAFLLYLGSFGASEYMLKVGAREYKIGGRDAAVKVRTNALVYGFSTTAALTIGTSLYGAIFMPSHLDVLVMSALVAVSAICYNVFDAYFRSTRKYLWFSGMLFFKASLILVIAFVFIKKFALNAVIMAEILGFVLVFLAVFLLDFRTFKISDINSFRDELSLMVKHGVPTILVNMARNLSLLYERYFISFALGFVALGQYSFVMIIYQSSIMGGGILMNVLGPRWLSQYAEHSSPQLLFKSIGKFSLGIVAISLASYPIFYFVFPMILERFFEKYNIQEVTLMAHIVYWTSVTYLVASFLDWFFIALSKERIALLISIASLFVIVLSFLGAYYFKVGIVYYALFFMFSRVLALMLMVLTAAVGAGKNLT